MLSIYVMEGILLGAILLLSTTLTQCVSSDIPCHPKCKCFWWRGKQAADCSSAGFKSISDADGLEASLQVLNMTRNSFKALPRNAFVRIGLVNLQKVYLPHCGIESIDDSALRLLSNLVELDLSHNALSYVPTTAFRDLPLLRVLDLTGNRLGVVPTLGFSHLKSLVVLRLSECDIRAVAERAFEGLEGSLEVLLVDGNALTTLRAKTLTGMKRLHTLTLVGNPWTCDCELWRLRERLRDLNLVYVQPTCYRPVRLRGKRWIDVTTEDCSNTVFDGEDGMNRNREERRIPMVIAGMLLEILSAML